MRKLLQGIVDFRNRVRPVARETFARLIYWCVAAAENGSRI